MGGETEVPEESRSAFVAALSHLRRAFTADRVLVPEGLAKVAVDLGLDQVEEVPLGRLADAVSSAAGPCVVLPPWEGRPGSDPGGFWAALEPLSRPLLLCIPLALLGERHQRSIATIGDPAVVVVGQPRGTVLHHMFQVAVVAYTPSLPDSKVTRFFVAPDTQEPRVVEKAESDLKRLLRQQGGTTAYGFIHRGDSLRGRSLMPVDHDPEIRAKTEDLAGFGETSLVEDVFEVLAVSPQRLRDAAAEVPDGRLIRGQDITKIGELRPPEDRVGGAVPAALELQAGDVLMRATYLPSSTNRSLGIPAVVSHKDLPLWANSSVLVLRPRRHLSPDEGDFYRLYLGSRRCLEVMKLRGPFLKPVLAKAPLPRPDADLLEAIGHIRQAQTVLQTWIAEGSGLTSEAFDGTAATSRRNLIESGRLLRQRVEAGQRIGSLENRIATFYPYPIAHRWRVARAAEGAGQDSSTYTALLDCFEATLSFTAALALAFAHHNKISVAAMDEVRGKLSKNDRGPSLGDWTNILKEVSSGRSFKKVDPDAPLAMIRQSLPEGSPAAQAQERLSRRRNDESHQRRVDPIDLPEAIEATRSDLRLLLEHLGFLSDLPILQVRESRWDSITGSGVLTASLLQGDHPIGSVVQLEHSEGGIEVDSLYAKDISGALVLLRPFLVRHECPTCRTSSTFHPDRSRDGRILLKAVDHSHTIDGEVHRGALTSVGYLP